MKNFVASSIVLPLILLLTVTTVWTMPPHPDLVARIQNHAQPEPYFLKHLDELRALGVDSPSQIRTLEMLRRRSLDDNINILVILVDFSDHTSRVQPSNFDSLLYGHQTGTLNDFYEHVSYGNLSLVSVNMPGALGWKRMPQTYAYYVDNMNGEGSYPQNAQKLTEDAVQAVDSVVDFSQYDNDGDGYVDALFVLHSGPGAEFTGRNSDIWSHSWVTHSPVHVDGVMVYPYSMEPEYWQVANDMTCGVFAHEMGHSVFGLPDLYDTGYNSAGLGDWSLMAGGSWNGNLGNSPAEPDAWCRIQMGFVTPTVVSDNLLQLPIPNVEGTPRIYRLWSNGESGNEYYLVENRERNSYDLHLPGAGLLIYHIDQSVSGNDNPWYPGHTGSGHYEVALEQADGQFHLERDSNSGDAQDPYPSSTNSAFTSGTTPSSRSYAGTNTQVSVYGISPAADTVTANLAVVPGAGNLVSVQLPDTNVSAGDTVLVPVVIDDVTGQTITSIQFTITCDDSIAQVMAPYYDLSDGMIPQGWTVNATHSPGELTFGASGTTPLTGGGVLLKVKFHVLPGDAQGSVSALTFTSFIFNQGTPLADIGNGSMTVAAAHILLQPSSLSFGNVQAGHSATRTVIVRNNGNATLTVTAVTARAPFSTDFTGSLVVLANHWTPVQVTFNPDSARNYGDTVLIASNAAEGTIGLPVSGIGTSLGASNSDNAVPTRFALSQNFPNPFNPSTVLNFDVPRSARVTISVYNVLGQLIDSPLNSVMEPGHHSLTWACPSCGSGIYLFVMSADGLQFTQKAMLMK